MLRAAIKEVLHKEVTEKQYDGALLRDIGSKGLLVEVAWAEWRLL